MNTSQHIMQKCVTIPCNDQNWNKCNLLKHLYSDIHYWNYHKKLSKSTREVREMPSGLILREGETPTYTSQWERGGNVMNEKRNREPNESRNKNYTSAKYQRPSRRANERIEFRATFQDQKLSFKWPKGMGIL